MSTNARADSDGLKSGGIQRLIPTSFAGMLPPNVVLRKVEGLTLPSTLKLFWRRERLSPVALRFIEVIETLRKGAHAPQAAPAALRRTARK